MMKTVAKQESNIENNYTLSGNRPPRIISVADLIKKELSPPVMIVDYLLSEGLALLAGSPKVGKSWLALLICLCVAQGSKALSKFQCVQGSAIYLGLEDSERRLQGRIIKLLGESTIPQYCYCACEWPQFRIGGVSTGANGFSTLCSFLDSHADTRLVVIDTLAKVRSNNNSASMYERDYRDMEILQKLALDRKLAIILVHHLRKQNSRNQIDDVSGSAGLTGCADTIWILNKSGQGDQDGTLWISGRDVEEQTLSLQIDQNTRRWVYLGDADEEDISDERKAIIEFLSRAESPKSPLEIAEGLGQPRENIRRLLAKMAYNGTLYKPKRGQYAIPVEDKA
jgi:hypothetical protein